MNETLVPSTTAAAAAEITATGTSGVDSSDYSATIEVASLRRIAVRGAAFVFAARLIVQLFSWVATLVTARILFPHDYGIVTAAGLFTVSADILAEAGMCRALVQKTQLSDDDLAGGFTFSLMCSSVMYILLFACAGAAAKALQTPELALVLPVVGLSLFLIPFRSVSLAVLERRLQLKRSATIGMMSVIVQGCVVLSLALAGFGYWALTIGFLVPKLLEVPVLAWQAAWVPRLGWPGGWSNPIVSYGVHFTGAALCWYAYRNVDYAVVGRLLGPVALGYYSLAFMLISMPVDKLVATCNRVSFPVFCRIAHDRARIRDWYLRLCILFGFVATPTLVGLALAADDAVRVVLGEKWLPAVLPLQIMSLAGVIMILGSSIDVVFNALGRPDVNFRFTALSVVIYPPLFYFFGRLWGVVGVASVWAICYPIMVLLLIATTRSITGVSARDVLNSQLPLWASAAFMALVVAATGYRLRFLPVGTVRLGILIAAGALSYAAAIRVLAWESVMTNVRLMWRELKGT